MRFCHLAPGPAVGFIKSAIEEAILQGEIDNTFDAAHTFMEQNWEELLKKFTTSQKA
jgi:uncharacterized protein YqgV (UPF0045/DUF77 family)